MDDHHATERQRLVIAGVLFALGVLAFAVFVLQTRTAECNWASPIGSFDSTHGFTGGTGPSWWLFLASTILLAGAGAWLAARVWVRVLILLPLWLVALFVVFVGVAAIANPCHESKEPPVQVICQGDDWRSLDRGAFGGNPFSSRRECINYFHSLGWR